MLGGSHARGRARPESDIDLYLLYSESAPLSIQSIRELAGAVNDTRGPVVTDFYGWGPWVNGGGWLTIGGQRVDFVYRSLEHVERVIADAEAGRCEQQQVERRPLRIAVGPDGRPWVLNAKAGIFQWNGSAFELRPGSAYDIGVGANGAVWVVGTDQITYGPFVRLGFGIYRWNGSGWIRIQGAAANISVDSNGLPYVANAIGGIFKRE